MKKYFGYGLLGIGILLIVSIKILFPPYKYLLSIYLASYVFVPIADTIPEGRIILAIALLILWALTLMAAKSILESVYSVGMPLPVDRAVLRSRFGTGLVFTVFALTGILTVIQLGLKQFSDWFIGECTIYTNSRDRLTCYSNYDPDGWFRLLKECSTQVMEPYNAESCLVTNAVKKYSTLGFESWNIDCNLLTKNQYANRDCVDYTNVSLALREHNPALCPTIHQYSTNPTIAQMQCVSHFPDSTEWKTACAAAMSESKFSTTYLRFRWNCYNNEEINENFPSNFDAEIGTLYYPNLETQIGYTAPLWFDRFDNIPFEYLENKNLNINTVDSLGRTRLVNLIQSAAIWWNGWVHDTALMDSLHKDGRRLFSIGFNTHCQSCIDDAISETSLKMKRLLDLGINPRRKDITGMTVYDSIEKIEVPAIREALRKQLP